MKRSTIFEALIAIAACGWMLLFAHNGLWASFSGDDLMNLNGHLTRGTLHLLGDCFQYWSTSYRPLGGLFYAGFYGLFGFHPLPFRLACFALLALNLGLLGRFAFRLSGSREIPALVLLLAGYNAWLVDLYHSTGTVYDLLAYFFFFSAFNLYLGTRQRSQLIGWQKTGVVTALYICALNAKEAAVTLPVLFLAYELIYHPHALRQSGLTWLWREGRAVVLSGLLTVPYILGKTMGAGSLVENPAYRLTIDPVKYVRTFHMYLNVMLYQDGVFRSPNTIQLVSAMLVLAVVLRSKPLIFAWCFLTLGLFPVAFIAHYAGFFIYFPMVGWALYAATLLSGARRLMVRALTSVAEAEKTWAYLEIASAAALPILLALVLAPYHQRQSAKTLRIFQSAQPPSRELATALLSARPRLPRGAHILFLGDPFPRNEYFLLFLTRLVYHDLSITVDKASPGQIPPIDQARYEAAFAFKEGQLIGVSKLHTRGM